MCNQFFNGEPASKVSVIDPLEAPVCTRHLFLAPVHPGLLLRTYSWCKPPCPRVDTHVTERPLSPRMFNMKFQRSLALRLKAKPTPHASLLHGHAGCGLLQCPVLHAPLLCGRAHVDDLINLQHKLPFQMLLVKRLQFILQSARTRWAIVA